MPLEGGRTEREAIPRDPAVTHALVADARVVAAVAAEFPRQANNRDQAPLLPFRISGGSGSMHSQGRLLSTVGFTVCLVMWGARADAQLSTSFLPASPPLTPQAPDDEPPQVSVTTTRPALGTTDWTGLVGNSLRLVSLEHATRLMLQPGTRRALAGPFISDYLASLRRPHGWNDGDSWAVNYVGHPIHGAAAGFVWIAAQNRKDVPVRFSREFWTSRGQAALWAAAYSLQFELGPLSEASIGNVGFHPETTGWVDHVVTPVGALMFMVLEDWVDHHVILRIERKTGNVVMRAAARIALNPSRSMSAMAQGQMPWTRADRHLRRQ